MNYDELALQLHKTHKGKVEVVSKTQIKTAQDLSTAYTPGVAAPCKEIAKNPTDVFKYTAKGNLVAVVTDGTAVLGLGDIGPQAALPVMEGKAVLFKEFANVDAFPICLDTKDTDEIVKTVVRLAPTFGGINLEDIAAPRCFEIEQKLKEQLDIPVFHDDQHGTAIVLLAALINALKIVDKKIAEIKIVINGAGSAGSAIAKLLMEYGAKNIVVCDSKGIVTKESASNAAKMELSNMTNPNQESGTLEDAMKEADVFIGVSAAGCVSQDMVRSMNSDPIVFAMANPVPEIMPDLAKEAGARIVGTGRSDFANQINNVLVFPGIFRGALDVRAREITEQMKLAAAKAIASLISENELKEEYVIPSVFHPDAANVVAKAVAQVAKEQGITQI